MDFRKDFAHILPTDDTDNHSIGRHGVELCVFKACFVFLLAQFLSFFFFFFSTTFINVETTEDLAQG